MSSVIAGGSGSAPGSRLSPMLEAGSVAVIGASNRAGTVGRQIIRQLAVGGFGGSVHPVNPRYERIGDLTCAPTIGDVGAVDLAVIAVANDRLEEQVRACLAAGARSLALFASCHGATGDGTPLSQRLSEIARDGGVPVCGGNGMGFVNLDQQLRICGFHQPLNLIPGGVTFLSHSGSLFSAMLHNHRRLDFNLVASTGTELATTMDEYLSYAVEHQSTKVIGLFVESVRRPEQMAAALASANAAAIPVVALKVGRNARSRASVATHSTAIAGEYGGFEAFASFHGVHLVDTMDELADTLQLFAAQRVAAAGGLGAVHDSGGERSLLIDIADRVGVRLADIGPTTRAVIAGLLEPGLEPDNPVDAWGTGHDGVDICRRSLLALADDDDVGALVFGVDLTAEETPDEVWGGLAIEVFEATHKPVAVLANLAGGVDSFEANMLAEGGVPVLRGTETGLLAIRHLFADRDWRAADATIKAPAPSSVETWRHRLRMGPLSEPEGFRLLSDFGLDVVESTVADDLAGALAAARVIGFPVVMKTSEGVAHKSDVGGVLVGIENEQGVELAYAGLSRLGPRVLVQQMAPEGVEISIGLTTDDQFGSILVVAAGGVLVEVLADRAVALPSLSRSQARSMVERLKVRQLLEGNRGRPVGDIESLVDAILAIGCIGMYLGDVVDSVDVNPVIVHPGGCVAVDVLVVSHE